MSRLRREKTPPIRPPRRKAATPAPPAPDEAGPEPGLRELRASLGNLRAAAEALATAAIPRPERSARASRRLRAG